MELGIRRFDGKTTVVTGGASGIGEATVRRLLDEGGNVVVTDLRDEDCRRVAEAMGAGRRIAFAAADVADAAQVNAVFDLAAKRFGAVQGLVNSAGIRGVGSITDTSPEVMQNLLAVNVQGPFNTMRAFARAAEAHGHGGAIVNLSSTAGLFGLANRVSYATAKHGIIGLSRAAAVDLAPRGIRVNAIAPGMIRTPMTATMFADPENEARIRADHPLGREGQPEDVAAAIAFLLSDDAAFITGVVLPVDGGKTSRIPSR